MSDLTVPNEILRQLGGRRFQVMTGARNLLGDGNSLQMSLPRGSKVQRVTVRLDPSDTYTRIAEQRLLRRLARGFRGTDRPLHAPLGAL